MTMRAQHVLASKWADMAEIFASVKDAFFSAVITSHGHCLVVSDGNARHVLIIPPAVPFGFAWLLRKLIDSYQMDRAPRANQDSILVLSCDGDHTLREGDWLRLWNSLGLGIAHDVWVAIGGVVYENSGPGGFVRRNTLANVLAGRKVIHIVARTGTVAELQEKVAFAESRLGTLWAGSYNCQDFASEVATGRSESFQREALLVTSLIAAGVALWASNQELPRRRRHARRS